MSNMGMRRRTPSGARSGQARIGLGAEKIRKGKTNFKREKLRKKDLETGAPFPRFSGAGSACASAAGLITHAAQ
jgi:hypothetical protein